MNQAHAAPSRPAGMLRHFADHRHLLVQFIRRELEVQTRGSLLGALWWILNPLLMLGLYTVVFGMVMGGHFEGIEETSPLDYPLGIFVGLAVLGLVTEALNQSTGAIVSQSNLVQKVRFPTEILSTAKVGAAFVRTLISLTLALVGITCVGPGLEWQAVFLPVVILPLLMMGLGLGWLLSSLGVYVRDSQHFMSFLSSVIFYTSAVFYAAASIPPAIMQYLRFNPVLHAVEQARGILLWHHTLDWGVMGYLYLWGIGSLAGGFFVFQRLKDGFADVL